MASKLHTIGEARSAKQSVSNQLGDMPGISLGIGQTESGNDYAVLVLVEDERTVEHLPTLSSELPVRIKVTGKVTAQ